VPKFLTLVLIAALSTGCGHTRVSLRPVPEKSAPLAERIKAFKDLAPESGISTNYYRNGVQVGSYVNSVMLTDGTRVEDPRDLLPAVDVGSPAANYIQAYDERLAAAGVWSTVGWSVFAAGLATMLVPLAIPYDRSSTAMSPAITGLLVGGGIMVLSLIPIMVAASKGGAAQTDRLSAFQTYPRALQKKLALDDAEAPVQDESKSPSEASLQYDAPLRHTLALTR
jgi:hypothetical protein